MANYINQYNPKDLAEIPRKKDSQSYSKRKYTQAFNDGISEFITIYRQLPWLKEKVDQILINPIKNIPEDIYDSQNFKTCDNVNFYNVKLPYYYMRQNTNLTIDENNIAFGMYNGVQIEFQVGLYILSKPNKIFTIQNVDMYEKENQYINKIKNSKINLSELKTAPINSELKTLAKISLEDYTPNKDYTDNLIRLLSENATSYDFAYKISKIIAGVKFGNLFAKRLLKGYYREEILSSLGFDVLFEGVITDLEKMENYIEDSANNILLYSSKYYDIQVRKYQRNERKIPYVTKFDIRTNCENISDTKNISEENLTFYSIDNKFYCYDLYKLFFNFKKGNYINPNTNNPFPQEFIQKINSLYSFKTENLNKSRKDSFTEEDYDNVIDEIEKLNIKEDTIFLSILEIVRKEIENLQISESMCELCKRPVGRMGIVTINSEGKMIKNCSKNCFEKN